MWIVNQRRDKIINLDNVKQIRCFEDGEVTADGIVLGKYNDEYNAYITLTKIVNALTCEHDIKVIIMEEANDG